ncbi:MULTISPECIES: HPP family protein [unclassified Amycolatopsis]|uniref:CBS domain-containing protein n=1 Tax=unclassified Amycolatopsis TaxID=2618356 RepID=UPI001C6956E0|nr:CBS domain-containing protein [Amycolatopsis sp. DSM 110486]QYN18669.1 CBS domain-containing protein [Amycolatopsis sp. DSM 110486]
MRTRDIMTTPVISVTFDASLAEAAHLMTRQGFTTLPVVTRSAKLVGLISERDLVQAGFPGDSATGDPDTGVLLGRHRTVSAVMRTPAPTATPELDATALAHRMTESGVRALPVVDDNGLLVGIVTYQDLLRVLPAEERSS